MKLESKNLFSFSLFHKKPAGIFFSGSFFRYVSFKDDKGLNVQNYGEVDIGGNILEEGGLKDEESFFYSLKTIKDKINTRRVRLVVPENHISNSLFETYERIFKKAGLHLVSIESEIDAIIRGITGDNSSGYFLVNIDTDRSYCAFVLHKQVKYMRYIHGSLRSYVRYVANEIGLLEDETEALMRKHGLDRSFTSKQYSHAVFFGASFFSEQINNCIIECNVDKDFVNKPIDQIILLGRGSNLVDFKNYLSQALSVSVSEPNIWKKLKHKMSDIPEISFDKSMAYASVLGAIVDDWK